MNRELPDVQAGFRKGRRTRDQIVSICWIIKKAKEFQENIYFCFTNYAKDFKRDGNTRPPSLSPENLYAGQEATGRTRPRNMDWSKIGKGV